jgi:hypothetical protein
VPEIDIPSIPLIAESAAKLGSLQSDMIEFLDSELRPARYLVVAFTGIRQLLGEIPFEFYKSLGRLDCTAMYVMDTSVRWYQYPRADISKAVQRLRRAMQQTHAERVTFLGNSMGGFGALLFGALCEADAILSFSPQTVIDPVVMAELGDYRYEDLIREIPAFPYGDLLKIPPARGLTLVCVGENEPLDLAHAERLRAVWKNKQMIVPNASHDAAAVLKENADLLPLIAWIMTG